jgi:long-chain acyl-CoA synthetase
MSSPASANLFRSNTSHANVATLDHENIARYGTYTRLHFEGGSLSNLEELQHAGRIARVLKEKGVRTGDRVLAAMPNSPVMTAFFQAVWTIGAIAVPVAPQWTIAEMAYGLTNSGASVVLTIPALSPKMREAARVSQVSPRMLCFGETDTPGFENIKPECDERGGVWLSSPENRTPGDVALLLYTSGTLAKPKAVIVTHEGIPAAMEAVHRVNPSLPRRPILHVLPLNHVFGVMMVQLSNRWGFSSVLVNQFDPPAIFRAISEYKIGYVLMVPTMLMFLLHHPERPKHDYSSLYRIITGGASLPEPLRLSFQQAFRCRVDQGYGMSEAGFISCYGDHESYRPGSSGWPCPGFELRVVDEQDRPLPPLSVGEICVQGPSVTPGYWNDPDAGRDTFRNDWFHTGDVGYVDGDGYLYITDRKKDLVIKGGENISPREIEEVMYLHPSIAEAAVVGVPDAEFGEEICAVVQLRDGTTATESEIREHIARYISKFKVPAYVVFVTALPRTSTGKVHKQTLREQLSKLNAA